MNILITGGHSGMGLELTKRLLLEGQHIGLVVRNEVRKKECLNLFSNHNSLDVFVADLSKRSEIAAVANQIIKHWPLLDGLFNNAGLLLDKLYYSDHGNELQLEVNGISPYLLTKALKPLLDQAENPFVVSTATGGLQTKKAINISEFKQPKKFVKLLGSYMDSKLILVLLMNFLSKRWTNIRFVNVNLGPVKTKMTIGNAMPLLLKPIRFLLFSSPEKGGRNLYNAAFNEQYQDSGILISGGKVRKMQFYINDLEIKALLS